jgi:hypothetical protein
MAFLRASARFSLVVAVLSEIVSITLSVAIAAALKNTFANRKSRGIMKAKPLCLFVVSAIFLGEIAFASPTLAADSWLPVFVPDQHTYVAPVINNGLRSDFISPSFKNEVAKAAKKQKLDVYVVVTRSESDTGENLTASGPLLVRKLWQNWHSDSSGFASSRAVIILMTGGQDGKLVSVGVRAGETLNGVGINRATMNDPNGPVKPVLKEYLVQSPAVVPVKIVNNMSDLVAASSASVSSDNRNNASVNGANESKEGSSTESSILPFVYFFLILGGAVIGIPALLYFLFKPRHSAEKTTGEDFETRLRSSFTPSSEFKKPISLSKAPASADKGKKGKSSSSSTSANTRDTSSDGADITPIIIASSCSSDSSHTSSHTSTTSHTPASSCSTTSHSCSSCGGSSCGGGSCGGG